MVGSGYQVYSNTGSGDAINYATPVATTLSSDTTWTSTALAAPGAWKFGVRAFNSDGEEQNLDCAATIVLDAFGNDITNQPLPPTGLRSFGTPGGGIRTEWWYALTRGPTTPTSFNVYLGTGGTPDYATPIATVLYSVGIFNVFVSNVGPLSNGVTYTIGVRTANASGEEKNTVTVFCTADSTGPSAVDCSMRSPSSSHPKEPCHATHRSQFEIQGQENQVLGVADGSPNTFELKTVAGTGGIVVTFSPGGIGIDGSAISAGSVGPGIAGQLAVFATSATLVSATIGIQIDQYVTPYTTVADAATITCNWAASNHFQATLGGNRTIAQSNETTDQTSTIKITQAASGGPYTATFAGTISWYTPTFTAPTMPITAGASMYVMLRCTGAGTYDGFSLPANAS